MTTSTTPKAQVGDIWMFQRDGVFRVVVVLADHYSKWGPAALAFILSADEGTGSQLRGKKYSYTFDSKDWQKIEQKT